MESDAFRWGPSSYARTVDSLNSVLSVIDVFTPVLEEVMPEVGEPLANVVSTATDCSSTYTSVSQGVTMGSVLGPIGSVVGGAAGECEMAFVFVYLVTLIIPDALRLIYSAQGLSL